ncbi:hypothetical protein [Streptomonospora litoralis]|uniref:Uncharacterized protein n=1 Tax=Streptomonospora litoralis TaxID=2498135 RepID=A0A4P6Q7S7_9ACTN|nr:hypothetical protein [Streptomonospora litoralis]QBI56856.1 hypothetical protein EKD16_25580 [Streptomonospora litoralis]
MDFIDRTPGDDAISITTAGPWEAGGARVTIDHPEGANSATYTVPEHRRPAAGAVLLGAGRVEDLDAETRGVMLPDGTAVLHTSDERVLVRGFTGEALTHGQLRALVAASAAVLADIDRMRERDDAVTAALNTDALAD